MKNNYLFGLVLGLLLCVSGSVRAHSLLLTRDAISIEGFELTQYYNFLNLVCGVDEETQEFLNPAGTSNQFDLTINNTVTFTSMGATTYKCTTPNMEQFYFFAVNYGGAYWPRGTDGGGAALKNVASGNRAMAIADLQAGQLVVMQLGDGGRGLYESAANFVAGSDTISADGKFHYWTIAEDGFFQFKIIRDASIVALGIYTNADAPEYITPPALTMSRVSGGSRYIMITPGNSSRGNECTTYYSYNGQDPLFRDEEGNLAPIEGIYGDWIYEEGEEVSTDNRDFVEEGNVVTIQAVTVSSEGACSEIVTAVYSIESIVLNEPSVSLQSLSGTSRTYKVNWTNNTLCGEEFYIGYETGDGASGLIELGGVITAIQGPIILTVAADGYEEGIFTLAEVEQQGKAYVKKNGGEEHDWDFINLTDDLMNMVKGTYITGYTQEMQEVTITDPETEETTTDSVMVDVPVYGYYNWYFDSSRNRANLDVIPDTTYAYNDSIAEDGTIYTDTIMTTTCTYAEDACNLLNGIEVGGNAAPYVSSSGAWSSSVFIWTNGGGLWLTARNSTITIPGTAYGEYVVYNDAGNIGSAMAEGETATVSFSAAAYIHYIDIYTSDDLPSSVEGVQITPESPYTNVYSVDGRMVRKNIEKEKATEGLQKGIYIVNGKKVAVK